MASDTISASEFEEQFFEKEGIRVVLRCAPHQQVQPYAYSRRSNSSGNLMQLKTRINESVADIPYNIVLGDGNSNPHGLTKVVTARNSYKV